MRGAWVAAIATGAFAMACSGGKEPVVGAQLNGAGLSAVMLKRAACLTGCPVYVVWIHRDGRVTYDGRMHVRVSGLREATIEAADAAALLDSLDPALWETKWRSGCTPLDWPETSLTFRNDKGEALHVQYTEEGKSCPTDLLFATAEQIDLVAETSKWVTCPGGECPAEP